MKKNILIAILGLVSFTGLIQATPDQETYIREKMSIIAATMFVDDEHLQWKVLSLKPFPEGKFDVIAESTNGTAGYNPVRFIVEFYEDGSADAAAAYIQSEEESWKLLASDGRGYPKTLEN